MKQRFIIGVDPDIDASGVAIWDRELKEWLDVRLVPLEDTEMYLDMLKTVHCWDFSPENTIAYVEAGWKNPKDNFRRGHKSGVSEKIAMRVGMNHATSILTARMLKKMGWQVEAIAPLGKGNGLLKKDGVWTMIGKSYVREKSGYAGKLKTGEEFDAVYIVMAFR